MRYRSFCKENGGVFESLAGKLDDRRGVKRPLIKGVSLIMKMGIRYLAFI